VVHTEDEAHNFKNSFMQIHVPPKSIQLFLVSLRLQKTMKAVHNSLDKQDSKGLIHWQLW